MHQLFVYGSLKEGFPNFHVNKGRRLAGAYQTAERHAFWLFNGQLPCLLPSGGVGHQVTGQLFEVDDTALAAMDRLERVGEPGGYQRAEIEVLSADDATPRRLKAFVYLQDPALLAQPGDHLGPIAEYTLEHAKRLRW
jgi:gamma-glutamylaminecyclotransferase